MQLMVVKPSVSYFKIRYSDFLKFCGISYFIISLMVFCWMLSHCLKYGLVYVLHNILDIFYSGAASLRCSLGDKFYARRK